MTEKDAMAGQAADSDNAADSQPERPAAVEDEIDALRQQAEENWGNYLRAVAELDNLRKRSARELEVARRYGVERFVATILPVRDSLEAGLRAASEAGSDSAAIEALLEGERATLRLFDQALEAAGIAEIDPEGEPFDPERHEAMSMQPSDTAEPNSVIAVVQKGYLLHERVVRPARVIVAQPQPA